MDLNTKLIVLDIVYLNIIKNCKYTKNLLEIFSTNNIENNVRQNKKIIFNLFIKDIINSSTNKSQWIQKLRVSNHIKNKFNSVEKLINSFTVNTNLDTNLSIVLS
jgi:hypothetical protein